MTVQIKVLVALLAFKRAVVGGPVCGFVGSAVGAGTLLCFVEASQVAPSMCAFVGFDDGRVDLSNIWLAWSFQANFMFKLVL